MDIEELTLHMYVKGKKYLDLNCRKYWCIGAGLFVVLSEHRIENFDIYCSKVFHVKFLSGCFVGDLSVQNVVVATKSKGMQQFFNICMLISHGWLLVRIYRNVSSVENESNDDMEVI